MKFINQSWNGLNSLWLVHNNFFFVNFTKAYLIFNNMKPCHTYLCILYLSTIVISMCILRFDCWLNNVLMYKNYIYLSHSICSSQEVNIIFLIFLICSDVPNRNLFQWYNCTYFFVFFPLCFLFKTYPLSSTTGRRFCTQHSKCFLNDVSVLW